MLRRTLDGIPRAPPAKAERWPAFASLSLEPVEIGTGKRACAGKIFFSAAGSAAAYRRRSSLLATHLTQFAPFLSVFRPPTLGFSDEANSDAPNTEKERRAVGPYLADLARGRT